MKRLAYFFNNIEKYVCILLLAVTLVLLTIQVVWRYVLNSSPAWTEELARYCFVWLVFMGSSLAVQHLAHIKIDTGIKIYPRKIRKIMELLGIVLFLISVGIVIFFGAQYTLALVNQGRVSTSIYLPMWIVYSAIPVGYIFTFIRIIQYMLIPFVKGFKDPDFELNGDGGEY